MSMNAYGAPIPADHEQAEREWLEGLRPEDQEAVTAPDHEQAERIDFDAARHTSNVWARGEVGLPAETNLARAYLALAAQLAEAQREIERLREYAGHKPEV